MIKKQVIFLLSVLSIISCSKENEDVNHPPKADFKVSDNTDQFNLISTATDEDNDIISYKWVSESDIISITNSTNENAFFELPDIDEEMEVSVKYIVCDNAVCDTVVKIIELPQMTYLRKWGLGRSLEKEISNDVSYEWYIDQMNSGTYSSVNCGPSAATMAVKWFNKDFDKTAEDARNIYPSEGGWWSVDDITNYLLKYSVPFRVEQIDNIELLVDEIDKGNIMVVCLDLYHICKAKKDEWHIDKHDDSFGIGAGHFIVIKGYKIVDNQILFETYDPWSNGKTYEDNSLMGKNRYYKSNEIDLATHNWWDYAIVVTKENMIIEE